MSAPLASTRLGFGCGALPRDAQHALAVLEAALDSGITHFDAARMYDHGRAEHVLGDLAARRRKDMVIVTKAGITPPSLAGRVLKKTAGRFVPALSAMGDARFGQFAPSQVRTSVEASLRALRTEYVDALLLHEITPDDVTDGLLHELDALKREGKALHFGLATAPEHAVAIVGGHPALREIVQLPAGTTTLAGVAPKPFMITHSVLGSRLHAKLAKLAANDSDARRFRDALGVDGADSEQVARLLLRLEMARNPDGVVLFSSSSPARIRANATLLAANADTELLARYQRYLAAA